MSGSLGILCPLRVLLSITWIMLEGVESDFLFGERALGDERVPGV